MNKSKLKVSSLYELLVETYLKRDDFVGRVGGESAEETSDVRIGDLRGRLLDGSRTIPPNK